MQIVGPAKDDICYATQNRQNAVKAMAKRVDLVLVVGAPNSSNTLRLVEVAKAKGVSSRRIESAEELEHDWFIGVKTIGITRRGICSGRCGTGHRKKVTGNLSQTVHCY